MIDDDDDIRAVARASLERIGGYGVVTAGDGASGVDTAARERPDAILLDVMMPGMDGPSTLAELRARDLGHVPVILLTAKTQAADRRSFAELDVAGVIVKPFDPMQLPAALAERLGWDA